MVDSWRELEVAMFNRFDRQVRIWGTSAQVSLERAHVCLVAGSFSDLLLQEVLKSLTLSGIGEITLVLKDPESLDGLGDGFFLTADELFRSEDRTVHVLNWEDFKELASGYKVVVAVNLEDERELESLVSRAPEPLVIASVKGNFGFVGLELNEAHFIIDSRPEYSKPDLRIHDAWPELIEFYESFDLHQWSSCGRLSEIPYPVILYHVVKDIDGKELANLSSNHVRRKIDQMFPNNLDDLNILEAKRFAHVVTQGTKETKRFENFLESLQSVIHQDKWFDPLNYELAYLLRCLRHYFYHYMCVPLSGDLPDMESSSELYGRLKSLYEAKYNDDILRFNEIMVKEEGQPSLSDGAERVFIKRLRCLDFLPRNRRTSFGELNSLQWQSTDRHLTSKKLPDMIQSARQEGELRDKAITFHTSSFIGGVASQEIIKLITHQHVPIRDSFVYKNEDLGHQPRYS